MLILQVYYWIMKMVVLESKKPFSTNWNLSNIDFAFTNYNDHTVEIFLGYSNGNFNPFLFNVVSCEGFERWSKDKSCHY